MQSSAPTSPETAGFRLTVTGCAALILGGGVLAAIGHGLPVYIVPHDRAEAMWEGLCGVDGHDPAAFDRYTALFGWHYALMNAGATLALAGVTGFAIAAALRFTAPPGTFWLRTPPRRWIFPGIGLIALGLMTTGIVSGISADQQRLYFPACADSIVIPIFQLCAALTVITPILLLAGLVVTRFFGRLPAPLHQWDASRPRWSWAVTLVFATAMLCGTGAWLSGIFSSDQVAPSSILILYLLASTRAALLAPRNQAALPVPLSGA